MGIPVSDLPAPDDAMGFLGIGDLVQAAGLTAALNECWILLGLVSLLALPILWWLGPVQSALPVKKLNAAKAEKA